MLACATRIRLNNVSDKISVEEITSDVLTPTTEMPAKDYTPTTTARKAPIASTQRTVYGAP